MGRVFRTLLAAAALAVPVQAHAADWWWVSGDSDDDAAVFVDGQSVAVTGDTASVSAVRVTRAGLVTERVWHGRCGSSRESGEAGAVARFACGSDRQRVENAALLAGLSPEEAARAIFRVRSAKARAFAPSSARQIS